MKKPYFKIISFAIILAFAFTACGEESDELAGFVWIPPGTFIMGSPGSEFGNSNEQPQHSVTLTQGFYMSKYAITQGQYFALMELRPSYAPSGDGKGRLPVEGVSWYDAIEFCNKLSEKYGLTPAYTIDKEQQDPNNQSASDTLKWLVTVNRNANGYRLPTEAEWEYACRAGTTTAYNTGADSIYLTQANYGAAAGINKTTEVGSYAPNAWGLYDMHGNVFEWCWDWYGLSYYSSSPSFVDPAGPTTPDYDSGVNSRRVVRGGSWLSLSSGGSLRSACRGHGNPSIGDDGCGFRVVRP